MQTKSISLFLCLIILLSALASCTNGAGGPTADTTAPADTTGVTVTTTLPDTEPETEPVPDPITVSLQDYCIVYPADADEALVTSLGAFRDAAAEKFDLDLELLIDSEAAEADQANEIVVGAADRTMAEEAALDLRNGDYLLRYDEESERILILGSDTERTIDALEQFSEDVLKNENPEMVFEPAHDYTMFELATYPLWQYYLDGVNIREYKVIVPAEADLLTAYAGQNIVDYFESRMGVTLEMGTDADAEVTYEILVGDTNREESDHTCVPAAGQYVMYMKNDKLVLQGHTYMVGGGFGMLIYDTVDPAVENQWLSVEDFPAEAEAKDYVFAETCTSAILMIGDGMGFNHIDMALANGLSAFVAQEMPHKGTSITRSQSVINGSAAFTDSAAAATALATGYKTINGMVGQNPSGRNVTNVREVAQAAGAQTAVITTDAITGATPAGFLAHSSNRNNTADIQKQINNLIKEKKVQYCVGSVGDNLYKLTRIALQGISDGIEPFFIMVEEGYIDKNSHNAAMKNTYDTVERFNQAIAYAMEFTLCHPGTALIVTADHETGGITPAKSLDDLKGVLSDSWINGHKNKLKADINRYGYAYTSYVGVSDNGCEHTNKDVPIYAMGAGTEIFHDTKTQNIIIARYIASIFGEEKFGQSTSPRDR